MKLQEWLHKGFKKGNDRVSLMLDAEVLETHQGYKDCPIERDSITKWCIVKDIGRQYIVAKTKNNHYFVKIHKRKIKHE